MPTGTPETPLSGLNFWMKFLGNVSVDWKLLEIGSARLGRRLTGALRSHVHLGSKANASPCQESQWPHSLSNVAKQLVPHLLCTSSYFVAYYIIAKSIILHYTYLCAPQAA